MLRAGSIHQAIRDQFAQPPVLFAHHHVDGRRDVFRIEACTASRDKNEILGCCRRRSRMASSFWDDGAHVGLGVRAPPKN
jgi:hypothetical protein